MILREINPDSRSDVARWVNFPFQLYQDCEQWVPPLKRGERIVLDKQRHPFYQHSTAEFYLAEIDDVPAGRIALIHNRNYIEHNQEAAGFFGFFEVIEQIEVARALLGRAIEWGRSLGFTRLYGPRALIGAAAGGTLVEGFEHRPALDVPYNYPYYDAFITDSGFVKDRDILSGYISIEGEIPERLLRIAELVKKRSGFEVVAFQNKDELRRLVPMVSDVHRRSFGRIHGHYPLTADEYAYFSDSLLSIADPRLIKLVMKDGEIIGFIFAYPDISAGLKRANGSLFPLGWLHLLLERSRTRWVNVNGVGILPEYQGLGANAMLYVEVARTIQEHGFDHADTVAIGEENFESTSDNLSLGATWYKRHRAYRLDL